MKSIPPIPPHPHVHWEPDDGAAAEPFRMEMRDESLCSQSLQWVMEIGRNEMMKYSIGAVMYWECAH